MHTLILHFVVDTVVPVLERNECLNVFNEDNNDVTCVNEENYSLFEISEHLKSRSTICDPNISRNGKEIKANQPRNLKYPKRKFGKEERSFLPS